MCDLSFPMHVKQDDNYYLTSVGSSLILFRAGSTPSSARSARWGPTHVFLAHLKHQFPIRYLAISPPPGFQKPMIQHPLSY